MYFNLPSSVPRSLASLLIVSLLSSCGAWKPYYGNKFRDWEKSNPPDTANIISTVFLIGDAGDPDKDEPALRLLERQLTNQPVHPKTEYMCYATLDSAALCEYNLRSAVVFLGDNIYHHGLPPENDGDREEAEQKLINQMNAVKKFTGRKVFIPGNHDWNHSNRGGLQYVNRQEDFVENYLDAGNTFLPDRGCPGPVAVNLTREIVMVFIDSEWWLHKYEKPIGPENNCFVSGELDLIVQLEDIIQKNQEKHIVVSLHHPLFSNSNHGGYYSLLDYIFPLRLVRDNWYIPLPVIGSLYPFMRKYGISRQDISHPLYQKLIGGILSVTSEHPNVVIATGHDHNLQLKKYKEIHHIVSGSGCKTNHVIKGNEATFVAREKGFAKINYYDNGQAWVEFWKPEEDGTQGTLLYRAPMYALNTNRNKTVQGEIKDYKDSVKTMAAGPEYEKGFLKTFFWGDHYRDVWATPVTVPYLDMKREKDGLIPIKMGGGRQTVTLRLGAADDNIYTLRSVNKDPSLAIREELRETFAEDIIKDQVSSAHPYGAIIVPKLSHAVGVFDPKPRLFYVPFTPLLGPYLDDFGGLLMMMELRAEEDASTLRQLGFTENIRSTRRLYEELRKDNDDEINDTLFLKTRLLDMLIGDWDRHGDQYRWGEIKKEEGSVYVALPKDRDQAFTKFDGVIPYLASRSWAKRELQNFDYTYNDVIGLNLVARNMDRRLLTELSREQWIRAAEGMKAAITDNVIEQAVKSMPAEVYPISGPEIADKLKCRRDQLVSLANEYYEILAHEVDVVGSDKHELVEVERLNDEETSVTMYKLKDRIPQQKIYERVFKTKETDEIRIYTLDGNDSILIKGNVKKAIKLRIMPGKGEDFIADNSHVGGWWKKTYVYDADTTNPDNILKGKEAKVKRTEKDWLFDYHPTEYEYNHTNPLLSVEYNVDDGLFLGLGVLSRRHGFKKEPYKSLHRATLNYAVGVNSYNFRYRADYYSLFAPGWDLSYDIRAFGPRFVLNYFGQGNESEPLTNVIDYHRLRMNQVEVSTYVTHRFTRYFRMGAGPVYQHFNVYQDPGRFFTSEMFPEKEDVRGNSTFLGVKTFSDVNYVDYELNPRKGTRWRNEINYFSEYQTGSSAFTNLRSDFIFYVTPNLPFQVTNALRIGGAHNIGDYKFFQSNFLSGTDNLRGYRRTRFAGRSSFYVNNDIRVGVFRFRNNIFKGNGGLIFFGDMGRVWADGEQSSALHFGYGPGLWINVFNWAVVSGTYGFSEEGPFANVNFGFFF